jgi:eukaryotic-like serine/threonine-protein kinase
VFYQLLTGRAPYEGASPVVLMHCHLNEPAPRPSAKVHEIPRALDDLVVTLMAKTPSDRPWDAVAVEVILTELRDKAGRGDTIPMVWPAPGSTSANPSRSGAGVTGEAGRAARPKKKGRKAGVLSTLTGSIFSTRSRTVGDVDESSGPSRAYLETLILVVALMAIGGLIVYMVWPPGREYLYKHAEALMASTERSDWIKARDEYLEPLDRRFPDNPYHEQTRQWLDKILLGDAEARAGYISSTDGPAWSQPKNNAERQFYFANKAAVEASKGGNDQYAFQLWKDLSAKLKPDDKEDRLWYLLALHRADQLEAMMRDRRQFVEEQMRIANDAFRAGRSNQAMAIRSKLVDEYSRYTDLADLFSGVTEQPGPGPMPARPQTPPGGPTPSAPGPESPGPANSGAAPAPAAPSQSGSAKSAGESPSSAPDTPEKSGPPAADPKPQTR